MNFRGHCRTAGLLGVLEALRHRLRVAGGDRKISVRHLVDDPPDTLDVPASARHAGVGPDYVPLWWAVRHDKQAGRIDAIGVKNVLWCDDIFLRLGHFFNVKSLSKTETEC